MTTGRKRLVTRNPSGGRKPRNCILPHFPRPKKYFFHLGENGVFWGKNVKCNGEPPKQTCLPNDRRHWTWRRLQRLKIKTPGTSSGRTFLQEQVYDKSLKFVKRNFQLFLFF